MRHLSALLKRLMRRAVPFHQTEFSSANAPELGKLCRTGVWIRDRLFFVCDEYGGAMEQ